MKILHTEASCGWGGQEIRILEEGLGMIRRGHQVQLICPREARIFDEAARRGLPVHALPIGRKKISGVLALRRYLKENAFDVINCHSSTDSWLAAVACASLKNPAALVRTRHLSAPVPPNRFTRWLYCSATRAIATTGEPIRQHLIDVLGIAADRVQSIPTGIDDSRFLPATAERRQAARSALGLGPTAYVVGIVATLRSWKGHRYLVEGFAEFAKQRPEARLVIVGDGPQREALEAQIAELGIAGKVLMPGNRQDVPVWLHAMDVFCLPSYANEGVPQALLQAMFSALPCITTRAGAIGEIAQDQRTALVVPMQDAQALADALVRLYGDRALGARLGAAASDWCRRSFTAENMLDRMEALFRSVAATGA